MIKELEEKIRKLKPEFKSNPKTLEKIEEEISVHEMSFGLEEETRKKYNSVPVEDREAPVFSAKREEREEVLLSSSVLKSSVTFEYYKGIKYFVEQSIKAKFI